MAKMQLRIYECETFDGLVKLVAAPNEEEAKKQSAFNRARLLSAERAWAMLSDSLFVPVVGVPARAGDCAEPADFNVQTPN